MPINKYLITKDPNFIRTVRLSIRFCDDVLKLNLLTEGIVDLENLQLHSFVHVSSSGRSPKVSTKKNQ